MKFTKLIVFLVITISLVGALAYFVGAIGGPAGNGYTLRLPHAAGLVKNNAVKIAGVEIGVIESITVENDQAKLSLRLDPSLELHEDAVAIVRAKSLLGEKYLQLQPGSPEVPLIADGGSITNVKPVFEVDEVLNALQPVLGGGEGGLSAALGPLLNRIDGLLADAAGQNGEAPVIERAEIEKALDDAVATVASVRRMSEQNEAAIGELVTNANRLVGDPKVERILTNLDKVAAASARDIPGLLDKAEASLNTINKLSGKLTEERMDAAMGAIDDLAASAKNLRKLSGEFEGVGADVAPLLKDLKVLARRLRGLNERVIRTFVQSEGIRVNLKTPKAVKARIDSLEE